MSPQNEPPTQSPVLNLEAAAVYTGRSKNALKILRHRRRGPRSFLSEGRICYYRADIDDWLATSADADSRFNTALAPTEHRPEARRSAHRRPAPRQAQSAA